MGEKAGLLETDDRQSSNRLRFSIALALGLGLTMVLLWLLGGSTAPVTAAFVLSQARPEPCRRVEGPALSGATVIQYVAPTGTDSGDCSTPDTACRTIQYAVDQASEGDEIRVTAGTYTSVNTHGGLRQVVYISKTVTIRGGYTTTNWTTPDPEANPTTLDAQGQGRVLYITGDPSAGPGQAISPTIEGLRITGGDAAGLSGFIAPEDGSIGDAGGGVYIITATAILRNNQVFSNTAGRGGGVYLTSSAATLSRNVVSSNTAEYKGGGVYLLQSDDATLSGNIVMANSAGENGGGIFLGYSAATLRDNTVVSNTATAVGGGLCVAVSNATLSSNVISSNTADKGGGLYLNQSNATLEDNTVTANTATEGGGLYLADSDAAILQGSTIISNTATGDGGGIYLGNSDATLSGNTVRTNAANERGGGLYLASSNATLSENNVVANTANEGGGLYLGESAARITSNIVATNTTKISGGGGLFLHASNAVLESNAIFANDANGRGGGLYLYHSHVTLNENTIRANVTHWDGGGLSLFESAPTLNNNLIVENKAGNTGSGLYVEHSFPHLVHTTIARNGSTGLVLSEAEGLTAGTGDKGIGVCVTSNSTVTLTNTILVSHTVGITVTAGSTATLEATLWGADTWANSTDWGGEGTILTGTRNIWGDPDFVDPNAGDYHIGPDSVAIDAGVDAGITVDIDGIPRPTDLIPDIGADERPAPHLQAHISAWPFILSPGQTVTYTLTVTSVGDDVATHVWLTDTLPTAQQAVTITTPGGSCTTSVGWGGEASCDLGTMAPGDSVGITLTAQVTTTPPAQLPWPMRNAARVTAAEAMSRTAYTDTTLQNCHVRLNDSPVDYFTVQAAVDASSRPDDVVKVAGYCTGATSRSGVTQMIYLSKTLTIQGGWDFSFTQRNTISYPTTLDAQGQGRVLYVTGDPSAGSGQAISPTIEGLRITGGNATGLGGFTEPMTVVTDDAGGGVHIITATATFRNNHVFSNTAQSGGGLFLGYSDAILSSNIITANSSDKGGGVFLAYSDATLNSNTVAANTADEEGGGLYLGAHSGATLNGNTVMANTAFYGGGLYVGSNATLNGNTVMTNTAGYGGGLCVGSNATLNGNTIRANASSYGGGLYLYGDPTLNSNIIMANTADTSGGGMHLRGNATLINNLIASNQAGATGSGLYIQGASPHLLHNTIARNGSADGGDSSGVYVTHHYDLKNWFYSDVKMANTILVGHAVGITVTERNRATLEGTLWGTDSWANATDWGGDGTVVTGTLNLWNDPAFICTDDACAQPYHIDAASPARDAAINVGVKEDIEGQMRPMGRGYDLGADEYPGPGLDIVQQPSTYSLNPGQKLTCTLVITSVGTENAAGVVLTDTLNIWQRITGIESSLGSCTVADATEGEIVTCWFGVMALGETAVVTLTAHVSDTFALGQAMTHTAVVAADRASNSDQMLTFGQDCHVRINDDETEYTTVQAAVDAASPGDLVKIAGYCAGTNERNGIRQQVYLDKSLTLQGSYTITNWTVPNPAANLTTLDAAGQGRVLYITGDISPTVEGLRITGGDAAGLSGHTDKWDRIYDAGGGVFLSGGDTTLSSNTIIANKADHGGGVYLSFSDSRLINNVIADNQARVVGSGLYILYSSPYLLHNTIARNDGGDGSGIHIGYCCYRSAYFGSSVTMKNTILVGHKAGLVLEDRMPDMEATLWGSNQVANIVDRDSTEIRPVGALNFVGDPAFVDPDNGDYRIRGFSAARDVGVDAGVQEDLSGQARPAGRGYDLGAYEYVGPALDLSQTAPAIAVNPGQMLTYTAVITSVGTESATGVVLTHTLAPWQQAIGAETSEGRCTIADGGWGGTVVCPLGIMALDKTAVVTLTAQVSTTVTLGQAMTHTTVLAADGDAGQVQVTMYGQDCHVRINDDPTEYTTIQKAVDVASPGDLAKVAGICVGVEERQGVRQQVYLDKSLTLQGGYTLTNWTKPDPAGNPTTLDALGQGRVLYITGEISPTLEGLHITGGDATGLGGFVEQPLEDIFDAGGGVYVITATPIFRNNHLLGNTAQSGGGLFLGYSDATLSNNTISANIVHEKGGGIFLAYSNATLRDNTAISNTARGNGGGLYLWESNDMLIGNTIISNTAKSGGGLYLFNSGATLSSNTITANAAKCGGGLGSHESDATLNSNTVISNTAEDGGGLCLSYSNDTLDGNIIISNTAAVYGGGLYLFNSSTTLSNNTITDNAADKCGGGLYLYGRGATLRGNTVTANTANEGGGLYLLGSGATLVNNLVADNRADSQSSGLYIQGASSRLLHTTVAHNTGGDGSGIYVAGDGTAILTNTILAGHTVGIKAMAGSTATLEATLWGVGTWANGTDWGGDGTIITGTRNAWGAPAFVAPDAGDYHIGPASAAIDTGVDVGVDSDIDGEPRPMGHGYDLGADEFVPK